MRPCLKCGVPTKGSRCVLHRIPDYPHHERQAMRTAVRAWRIQHGDVCPGYQCPPHTSHDLTADHVQSWQAQHDGATHAPPTYAVLCRACNARKHNKQR